tara:strand:- start:696 stop:953 length:258 start_codon:yes stop_codon:yes gene_type:complete
MTEKESRQNVLKLLMEANDSVFIALGNYEEDDDEQMSIDFAVSADEEEVYAMFVELFKNSEIRDEARKAILYSDYGKTDDSLNLN